MNPPTSTTEETNDSEGLEGLAAVVSSLPYKGFEAWDVGDDRMYMSLANVPDAGGGKLVIIATGDDHDLTTKGWFIRVNESVQDNKYRQVKLDHADDATAAFVRYPVQATPFPTITLDAIRVFEKNGGDELWAIHKDSNGEMTTFFKKSGVFDHWASSKVKLSLMGYPERIAMKRQNGYTEVTDVAYWNVVKRTICFADGTEL